MCHVEEILKRKKKKRKRVSMYVLVSNSTGPPTACCLGAAEIPHLFRLDPKHPFLSSRPSAAARPWYSCGAALQMGSLQSARLKITRGGGERWVFKPGWGCWERVVLSCSRGNFIEFQESCWFGAFLWVWCGVLWISALLGYGSALCCCSRDCSVVS